MRSRLLLFAVASGLLLAACTGSDAGESSTSGATSTSTTGTTLDAGTPVPTEPPIIVEVRQRLTLRVGECFAEAPEPPPTTLTTTTAVVPVTDESGVPVTNAAGSVVTEPPATTLPESEPVSVVDCSGSKVGDVYANACLGVAKPNARDRVEEVPCPGVFEHTYPGNRELEVAASRLCLSQFEAAFNEPYAVSELIAREWIPNAELWAIGDRRVVCTATTPTE